MAHLYKATEWESCGWWWVNDTTDLNSIAAKWWVPARILNLSLYDYVVLLKDSFNATGFKYDENTDVLIFHFTSQADARKYKNYINKIARERNYIV